MPYFTQIIKQEMEDDIDWYSLSETEQQNYKKMRKAVSVYGKRLHQVCSCLGEM